MKSLYWRALLWSFAILVLSFTGFLVISRVVTVRSFDPAEPIGRNVSAQFRESQTLYETGGTGTVAHYLERQTGYYPRLHFYFLKQGKDVVTGVDRSRVSARAGSRMNVLDITSPIWISYSPTGSSMAFLVEIPPADVMQYLPYYLLLLATIAVMCWGLAVQFATPLRQLAGIVARFGAGDLSARANSRRTDAIGDLGAAFDRMAARIENLLQSERRLMQDISHELRSPLARLSFAVELVHASPDRDSAVKRVNKEIERITALTESLMQATREDGTRPAHTLEEIALDSLLLEIVQDGQMEAAARGCALLSQGSSNVKLMADRELLRRAIENIVRNALAYAPPGSVVEATLNRGVECVSLSVRDYGPGVPADVLAEIFRPFFRVDSARAHDTGGTGLGLAIARRAVSLHNGEIWAENADPGLRICLNLPLDQHASTQH
jgi:signal transduction histidine kinase